MIMLTVISCVDKDFDHPPIGGLDPAGVTANTTIAQVKTLFAGTGTVTALPASMIFSGIVVSSDETGNIYKALVLEDATGGILIRVDRSSTYLLMPVGRRIFVKCAGLYISDYGGLIQLGVKGSGGVDRIPDLLIDQHLLRGQWGLPVPLMVTKDINSLDNNADQNKLVRLDSVHFDPAIVCSVWSDPAASTNRSLLDKNNNVIAVRTSNYSTFAADLIPGGIGSVVGVFQIYGSTKQFVIRGLKDVLITPTSSCGPPSGPTTTIAALRALYNGTSGSAIPADKIIQGVVISDKNFANITAKNMVIQDATGGIVVRFTATNTFNVGDEVIIDVSGTTFTDYHTLLEADAVPNNKAYLLNTGVAVTPRLTTLAAINTNSEAWESTLVKITGVTISGTGTYSGNNTMTDATGTLPLYTASGANFATTAYPTTPVSVTGIISTYDATQLNIRSSADVQP